MMTTSSGLGPAKGSDLVFDGNSSGTKKFDDSEILMDVFCVASEDPNIVWAKVEGEAAGTVTGAVGKSGSGGPRTLDIADVFLCLG